MHAARELSDHHTLGLQQPPAAIMATGRSRLPGAAVEHTMPSYRRYCSSHASLERWGAKPCWRCGLRDDQDFITDPSAHTAAEVLARTHARPSQQINSSC